MSGAPEVVLSSPPSKAAQEEAGPWIVGERIPEMDCEGHASTYAWMALNTPPAASVAGLDALSLCDAVPDRALVASTRLNSPDARVAGAALRLASEVLAADEAQGVDLASGIAASLTHSDPAVRYEAVEAMDRLVWTADPSLEAAMLLRLSDASPPVVSEVMLRAYDRAAGLQNPRPWAATARYAVLAHMDPGIRGRSAMLLARLSPNEHTTAQLLLGALNDPHPFVRASAAMALGDIGDPSFMPALVLLVSDTASTEWSMLPWTGTDGRRRDQLHSGSHFERVDDAALRAMVALSKGADVPYEMRPVSLRYLDLDLVGSARDAQRWFEEHGEAFAAVADDRSSE